MKLVGANEPGKSVKLHPLEQHRIFIDVCDDGTEIIVVKGRVWRVDQPGPEMQSALVMNEYGRRDTPVNPHTLLVETDEAPTPLPVVNGPAPKLVSSELADMEARLAELGFEIVPVAKEEVGTVVSTASEQLTPPTGNDDSSTIGKPAKGSK